MCFIVCYSLKLLQQKLQTDVNPVTIRQLHLQVFNHHLRGFDTYVSSKTNEAVFSFVEAGVNLSMLSVTSQLAILRKEAY